MSAKARAQAHGLIQQYGIDTSNSVEAGKLTDMVRMLNEGNVVSGERRSELTEFALARRGLDAQQRSEVIQLARNEGLLPPPPQRENLTGLSASGTEVVVVHGRWSDFDLKPALLDLSIDTMAKRTGYFVEEVGKFVGERPYLATGLEVLNVMAAPVAWGVNKVIEQSPLGEAVSDAQQRITGAISGRFADVGYDAPDATAGGIGAMAVMGAVASWGVTKVLSYASGAFSSMRAKFARHERFDSVEAFARATNDPAPHTTYSLGNVGRKTDRLGRLDVVEGPVGLNPVGRNDPMLQRSIGYNGPETDVGFHVWPDQWGGPTSMVNVVPGNGKSIGDGLRNLNNGDYADFERKVSALAADPAKQVEARMQAIYDPSNSTRRPDFFRLSYRVDNGEWSAPRVLENKWKND